MSLVHTFSGNPLDRGEAERRDPSWLRDAGQDARSRFLPYWKLRVLVREGSDLQLAWLNRDELPAGELDPPPVFLGLHDGHPHFAVDVSSLDEAELAGPDLRFEDARAAAMALPTEQSGIVAQSRSQVDWHRRHRFCSVCGEPTEQERGGHVRKCGACEAEHFPRTDPVAIMLIVDAERDCCLLGQSIGPLVRTGMYSALAGFIDQGESIEEAVRREVGEEAGIQVGRVRYHSSQPWPFPSSLMIGCHGEALSTRIDMDTTEMHDVRWFTRDEIRRALAHEHPTLKVPGPIAIAHHLIKSWADGEVTFSG